METYYKVYFIKPNSGKVHHCICKTYDVAKMRIHFLIKHRLFVKYERVALSSTPIEFNGIHFKTDFNKVFCHDLLDSDNEVWNCLFNELYVSDSNSDDLPF